MAALLWGQFRPHIDLDASPPIDDDLHHANINTLPEAVAARY